MDKLTYTPAEFAELFGKERTWAYRQLYAGKIKAVTKLGQIHIPKSEVEKLLSDVERYRGSPSHLKRTATRKARKSAPKSKGAKKWGEAITLRKKHGSPPAKNARSAGGRKPSSPARLRPDGQASATQSVYQRLTRYRSSQKDGEARGE